MSETNSIRTERWFGSRRAVTSRPLEAVERRWLIAARSRDWRRALVCLLAYVVGMVAAAVIGWRLTQVQGDAEMLVGYLAVALLLGALVATGWVLLSVRDLLRRAHSATADLKRDLADVFSSESEEGPAAADPLVIARASQRVVAGPPNMLGRHAPVVEVAAAPGNGYRVPVAAPADGSVVEQRHLSESEREELRQTIARMRWPAAGVWIPLVLTLSFGISLLAAMLQREEISLGDFLSGGFALAVSVVILLVLVRNVRRSFLVVRDLEAGIVYHAQAPDGPEAAFEYLPASGMVWTIGGAPAPGRSVRPASGRQA